MVNIPGMLMIGSVSVKTGKTELACSLLNRLGSQYDITGIKVTTVVKIDGSCPRGGDGCGVCSSIKGRFSITEETNKDSGKDTARILAAGARRVFWLRSLKAHLREGIDALLDIIGDDAISVCESNSLRSVVEPGVFLLVKGRNKQNYKASAKAVAEYVDRTVFFDGNEFDIDLSDISIVNGGWVMRTAATAIIMAGGGSVRMGQDKSMLQIDDRPMIKHIYNQLCPHFNQVLISANDAERYAFLGVEVVPDKIPGHGPLMGITSALKASVNELNLVIACDIPQAELSVVRKMLRQGRHFDAVVPTTGPSQYQPLFAVYNKSALAALEVGLQSGNNRIIDALSRCRVKYIDLTGAQWLKNLNTMNDYREFISQENNATI